MIAIIATIYVQLDKAEAFEAAVRELEVQVKANEPGCQLYRMACDQKDPSIYRSLEIFNDNAAIDFHKTQTYFWNALKEMRACLDGRPSEVAVMDTVS